MVSELQSLSEASLAVSFSPAFLCFTRGEYLDAFAQK